MKKFPIHKDAIIVPVCLILLIWIVYFIQVFIGFKECYGIVPLSFKGLRGIILAPLFHGNFQHLINNTVPLFVLTFLTFQFYERIGYFVMVNGWLASGFVVWMLPDFSFMNSSVLTCHIGASGLIYVLAFFLFFSGIFRKERSLMALSLIVVFLYGSMVWGMLPQEMLGVEGRNRISWESHLSGGVTGFILAFMLRKTGRKKEKVFVWEKKEYDSSSDEELWEQYRQQYPEYFQEETSTADKELEENKRRIRYIYEYKEKKEDSSKEKN